MRRDVLRLALGRTHLRISLASIVGFAIRAGPLRPNAWEKRLTANPPAAGKNREKAAPRRRRRTSWTMFQSSLVQPRAGRKMIAEANALANFRGRE